MQLANDPIISRRFIRSFRHLECQNQSIISDSIDTSRWLQKKAKKVRRRNLIHMQEDRVNISIAAPLPGVASVFNVSVC